MGPIKRQAKIVYRFYEKQKTCLVTKFDVGQETGHKMGPEVVARKIRRAKYLNGGKLIAVEKFLSSQQIALLCSSQDWLQKARQSAVASYVQSANDEKILC